MLTSNLPFSKWEGIFKDPITTAAAQEIIHMTRLQLGDAYKFAWTPATPEQGGTG